MPLSDCQAQGHVWDKLTGKKIKGIPHIGIKSSYVRTCQVCERKEKFSNGPVHFGWYSL